MSDPTTSLLQTTIGILASAEDLGVVTCGDPRLPPGAKCDLCNEPEPKGHMLSSSAGLALDIVTCGFSTMPVDPDWEGLFWICDRCHGQLHRDRSELLRRIARKMRNDGLVLVEEPACQ